MLDIYIRRDIDVMNAAALLTIQNNKICSEQSLCEITRVGQINTTLYFLYLILTTLLDKNPGNKS